MFIFFVSNEFMFGFLGQPCNWVVMFAYLKSSWIN